MVPSTTDDDSDVERATPHIPFHLTLHRSCEHGVEWSLTGRAPLPSPTKPDDQDWSVSLPSPAQSDNQRIEDNVAQTVELETDRQVDCSEPSRSPTYYEFPPGQSADEPDSPHSPQPSSMPTYCELLPLLPPLNKRPDGGFDSNHPPQDSPYSLQQLSDRDTPYSPRDPPYSPYSPQPLSSRDKPQDSPDSPDSPDSSHQPLREF